jgi:hypothetical protein
VLHLLSSWVSAYFNIFNFKRYEIIVDAILSIGAICINLPPNSWLDNEMK